MNTFNTKISKPKYLSKDLKQYQAYREGIFHAKSDSFLLKQDIEKLQAVYTTTVMPFIPQLFKECLNEKILSIEKIKTKSTYHILFLVKTSTESYVLKINIMEEYKDFSFILEARVQKVLINKNIPSVRVLCIDISREKYPFDFMIMSCVLGENIDLVSGKNAKAIYKEAGSVFKKIHSVTSKKGGTIDFVNLLQSDDLNGSNASWEDFFNINLKNHIQQATQIGVIEKKQEKHIQKLFIDAKPFFTNKKYSLLHNDPSIRNIKTDGECIIGIFDWEDAIFGDPLLEIAFVHTFLFREEDKEKLEAFCEGYGVARNELIQNLKYWLYYLRISLVKTINRYTIGYYNSLGFEIDKKRIQYALENIKKL